MKHNEYLMEQSFEGSSVPGVTVLRGSMDVTYNAVITVPLTCIVKTQTEPVIVSPVRHFIDTAINADYIVIPLNSFLWSLRKPCRP